MSENLVVIRTFPAFGDADAAQLELLSAGIYSLLVAEEEPAPFAAAAHGVSLAVHQRDAELAETVLLAPTDLA
ncbi:MAG TPA: hypothetical protein VFI96_00800 [Longimicrobiaceae bacterium]|nr:hypothetical protein [Longimicrobiaceae bacterium]